jgi:arylsulfatase A-like enzyme
MSRTKFFLVVLAAAAAGAAFLVKPRHSAYRCPGCNVILISVDTLRADHLGCYGYPRATSPHLNAFRREAVLFADAIAQAPSTEPSHASMMTSTLPSTHGALFTRKTSIVPSAPTMAEILRDHGYRTASFNGGGQLDKSFGFGRGFEIYESYAKRTPEAERFGERVSEGVRWMETVKDKPFFLFLHSYDVHHPYAPDPADLAEFRSGYSGKVPVPIEGGFLTKVNAGRIVIDDEDRRFIVDNYDAEIRGMDQGFARLEEYLRRSGLIEKTLIIFTSDHGEEFGEHGRIGWHGHTLYDELLRVPLIIRFPRAAFAGVEVRQQVRSIDILPTVLRFAGLEALPHFQGESLMPILEGSESPDAVRYALSQKDVHRGGLPTSVRTPKWKLYRGMLFDLEHDRLEKTDVAAKFPEVMSDLMTRAAEFKDIEPPAVTGADALKPETVDQLKSLGYLK